MPLYCKYESVRQRLEGKVSFTDDPENENAMTVGLAKRLMNEAEGQLEMDLSPRYMAPFQSETGQPFGTLPVRPTQEVITTLAELLSCIRILETDFGRGSAVNGEAYSKKLEERYRSIVDKYLLALKDESYQNWKLPPLPGMRLNFQNNEADNGYSGVILKTGSGGFGDSFPRQQINNPAETFWSVAWDDVN